MAKKSDKRIQGVPFQLRLRDDHKRYIETGVAALSSRSPVAVGFGPFLRWSAMEQTEKLTGVSFEEFEAKEKKGKGGR